MTPIRKRKPASLVQKTQPMKTQLLATRNLGPTISENEGNRNFKINKNVLAVRKLKTVLEPVLDIARRRARQKK
jgi:hypothetical protein